MIGIVAEPVFQRAKLRMVSEVPHAVVQLAAVTPPRTYPEHAAAEIETLRPSMTISWSWSLDTLPVLL
jgi:hypothetical protein